MLAKQFVPINLGKGIDTKTDPKQVQGKLLDLRNGVFQTGLMIRKRPGYIPLPSLGAGVMLSPYNNELVTLDGTNLYSYSASTSSQVNKGALPTVSLSTQTVIRNNNQQTVQDSAINGSIQCFTWTDSSGGVNYSVIDSATNQTIVNNGVVSATGTYAKVLAIGTKFVIIYYDSGDSHLRYRAIDTSTPTSIGSATDIATDINSTNIAWDATVINGKIFIGYNNSAAKISFYTLTSGLVLSVRVDFGSDNANTLTIFSDASFNMWCAYAITGDNGPTATKVNVFALNNALGATVLVKTQIDSFTITVGSSTYGPAINTMTGVVTSITATVYYEVVVPATVAGSPLNYIKQNTVTTGGSVGSATVFNRAVGLASKAISYSGFYYFLVAYQSNLQPSYFLIRSDDLIVGKLSPDEGGGLSTSPILPELNNLSSGVYQTASLVKDSLTVQNGIISSQTGIVSAKFTFTTKAPSKFILGDNLHVGGSILQMYDGNNVVEHGFSIFPEGLYTAWNQSTPTYNGGVGIGSSTAGSNTKQYCVVYEWLDNQGQKHQSAPSIPISVPLPTVAGPITITGDLNGAVSPPHGGNTITNVSGGSVSIGQYVNLISPNGQVNWSYNCVVTNVSGATVTVSPGYQLVASSGNKFLVSNYPLSIFFEEFPQPSILEPGFKMINGVFGQTIIAPPGAGLTSNYPAGTWYKSGSFSLATGLFDTNNPPTGLGNTKMYICASDNFSVPIQIPSLKLTQKKKVSLAVYATLNNGTIFYRTSDPVNLTFNDPTVDYVTFTDTTPDNTLVGNQQLYTTGGEVENIEVPAVNFAFTSQSRAIAIPSENPLTWWPSKQVIPGSPVEFNDSFAQNIDARIGAITAGGVLDEKMIFFGPTSIFYVVGSGPSLSGLNNDFTDAQLVTSDVGCSNQSSVVLMPFGLMFQSQKGIYLLDRSLQVQYIGADVEAFNSANVTSAQLMDDVNQVRFTMDNGLDLVYDYYYKQWDIFDHIPANDSGIFQEHHTILESNGTILQESPGTFTDNGAALLMSLTSNWMSFANISGFQRVYSFLLLGQYKSPHTLTINIYTDFNDTTPVQTVTIPVLSDPGEYEFRVFLTQQKCESMKIQIIESQPNGQFGEGFSISSMGFMVGVKKGYNKKPASASYG